jgi:hypothetical protein
MPVDFLVMRWKSHWRLRCATIGLSIWPPFFVGPRGLAPAS